MKHTKKMLFTSQIRYLFFFSITFHSSHLNNYFYITDFIVNNNKIVQKTIKFITELNNVLYRAAKCFHKYQ